MKTLHGIFSYIQSVVAEQAFIIVVMTALFANIAWLTDWVSGLTAICTTVAVIMVANLITAKDVPAAKFRLLGWLFFTTPMVLTFSTLALLFGVINGWVPTGAAVVLATTVYLMFRFAEPYR